MSIALCSEPAEQEITPDTEVQRTEEQRFALSRRNFLKAASALTAASAASLHSSPMLAEAPAVTPSPTVQTITLKVNGQAHDVPLDTRTSLLDTLREHLDLTGSKKGCDHGQCGACTVLLDGRRVNACLTLAFAAQGAEITTIEGLASEGGGDVPPQLHPVQTAFLEHDGYQCGYCTPGQICSAVAALDEAEKGELSVVSWRTGKTDKPRLSDDELRERMSGNICRCGAYPNIVAAVRASAQLRGVAS